MIDINNIVNTAIQQEINKAITNYVDEYMASVQQESRRQIEALKAQIACMEADLTQLKQQRADNPATGTGVVLEKDAMLKLLQEHAAVKQAVYEIAYSAAESVLSDHTEEYDHDSYDSAASAVEDANLDSLPDFDDFVTKDDMYDAVREAVRDTVENRVSVSLRVD